MCFEKGRGKKKKERGKEAVDVSVAVTIAAPGGVDITDVGGDAYSEEEKEEGGQAQGCRDMGAQCAKATTPHMMSSVVGVDDARRQGAGVKTKSAGARAPSTSATMTPSATTTTTTAPTQSAQQHDASSRASVSTMTDIDTSTPRGDSPFGAGSNRTPPAPGASRVSARHMQIYGVNDATDDMTPARRNLTMPMGAHDDTHTLYPDTRRPGPPPVRNTPPVGAATAAAAVDSSSTIINHRTSEIKHGGGNVQVPTTTHQRGVGSISVRCFKSTPSVGGSPGNVIRVPSSSSSSSSASSSSSSVMAIASWRLPMSKLSDRRTATATTPVAIVSKPFELPATATRRGDAGAAAEGIVSWQLVLSPFDFTGDTASVYLQCLTTAGSGSNAGVSPSSAHAGKRVTVSAKFSFSINVDEAGDVSDETGANNTIILQHTFTADEASWGVQEFVNVDDLLVASGREVDVSRSSARHSPASRNSELEVKLVMLECKSISLGSDASLTSSASSTSVGSVSSDLKEDFSSFNINVRNISAANFDERFDEQSPRLQPILISESPRIIVVDNFLSKVREIYELCE